MRQNRVYICHPCERYQVGLSDLIADAEAFARLDDSWKDWDIVTTEYDEQNGFQVQPTAVRILNKLGPLILLEPVQTKAARSLTAWLQSHIPLIQEPAHSVDEVHSLLERARSRFEAREPYLPRKFVVAVLLVRKLRKGNYWAGKDKGYLWRDELAKGRGVDERYAGIVQEVAEDLVQHELLVFKISQGKRKYALNPNNKPEVHAVADRREFRKPKLLQTLTKDTEQVSAHELIESHDVIRMSLTTAVANCVEATTPSTMLNLARDCENGTTYSLRVVFAGDRIMTEHFTAKRILLQFIEAFIN